MARLATVRPDGTPHVVPMTFALDGPTILSAVDDKPKSTTDLQRLRNIAASPAVSVLVDRYDDDWSRLWWARADGTARIEEAADVPWAVELLVARYAQYRERPPEGPVIVITVERWAAWSV